MTGVFGGAAGEAGAVEGDGGGAWRRGRRQRQRGKEPRQETHAGRADSTTTALPQPAAAIIARYDTERRDP